MGGLSLKKHWEKNFKDLGIGVFPLNNHRIGIATDAKRIILGALNEINILNFEGKKENTIKTKRLISSMRVDSKCTRILVWVHGYIVAYKPDGNIEFESSPIETALESGKIKISLDGKLILLKGKEYLDIWDDDRNRLALFKSAWGSNFLGGNAEYNDVDVAPDGSYIALNMGGGGSLSYLVGVDRIPNLKDLLKTSNVNERSEMWNKNSINLDINPTNWCSSTLLAAKDRLAMYNKYGGNLGIVDIEGNKGKLLYSHKLPQKGESIMDVKLTSDGRYLFYTSRRAKEIFFNIFEIESKTTYDNLIKFTIESMGSSAYYYPSHDGKRLVEVVGKESWRHRDINISLYNIV